MTIYIERGTVYDEVFKRRVLEEVKNRSKDTSITQIAKEHNVSPRTLYSWLYKYGVYEKRSHPLIVEPCRGDDYASNTALQQRNRELEAENAGLKKVIDILIRAIGKANVP